MAKAETHYKPEWSFLRKVGIKVRTLRQKQGLTLEELAFQSDISTKYLHEVETAKYSFSVSVLYSITKALNISLAQFFKDIS